MPLLFCYMHVISSAHASPWGQALPGCWRLVLKQVPFFLILFKSECRFEFCSLRCMLEIKVKIIILVTLEQMLPFLLNQLDFKPYTMMASGACCFVGRLGKRKEVRWFALKLTLPCSSSHISSLPLSLSTARLDGKTDDLFCLLGPAFRVNLSRINFFSLLNRFSFRAIFTQNSAES